MRKTIPFLALILLLPSIMLSQVKYICRPVSVTTTNAQGSLDPSVYTWQQGNAQQNIELYLPHATGPYTPDVFMQQFFIKKVSIKLYIFSMNFLNQTYHGLPNLPRTHRLSQ